MALCWYVFWLCALFDILIGLFSALMYIHRSFFAQAILDHPINPLRSAYAPSFLAAYRSASIVIKSSLEQYERFPDLVCRAWGVWTNCEHRLSGLLYFYKLSCLLVFPAAVGDPTVGIPYRTNDSLDHCRLHSCTISFLGPGA
jgi:hypothetical protein